MHLPWIDSRYGRYLTSVIDVVAEKLNDPDLRVSETPDPMKKMVNKININKDTTGPEAKLVAKIRKQEQEYDTTLPIDIPSNWVKFP